MYVYIQVIQIPSNVQNFIVQKYWGLNDLVLIHKYIYIYMYVYMYV
jgi:hypothetical protein